MENILNLLSMCGLSVRCNPATGELHFSEGLKGEPVSVRKRQDMALVVLEPEKLSQESYYYMYRDIRKLQDEAVFRKHNIRYDITVVPAVLNGREYNKTMGHYHPMAGNSNLSFPEIYEVLSGCAHYLLQSSMPPYNKIDEVILIEAVPGDKVVIPPNYGHITINPGKETLVMSNLGVDGEASIYTPYVKFRGGAYYEAVESGKPAMIPNPSYAVHPDLKTLKTPDASAFGLLAAKSLYHSFMENPESFAFLVKPELGLEKYPLLFT